MELHRKLFNQTFQVAKTSKKKSKDQEGNTSLERRCQQPSSKSVDFPSEPKTPVSDKKIKFTFSPRQKKPQNSPKVNDIARRFSLFNVNQSSNSIDKNQKVPLQQTIVSAIRGQIDNFKVKTSEYFSYYLNCFKIFNSDITEMVSFGTQKIYDYTDICFIVNKLLELEKLKHLILNEQQIKLFEFIPKPKIDLQIIGKYQNQTSEKEFKDSKQNNLNDDEDKTNRQGIQSGGDINGEDAAARKRKQINILSIQNRSLEEKANQAQLAFNHIYKNQLRKSKVDLKLIQMLDENLVQLFNSNTFDDNSTLFSGSIGGVNPEIDAMTFSKGISLHRIKLEKSHFRKQSEADSEINDPNEEMIDSTNRDRPCSYQTQGIILYENKQKNFIADTEKRNCSTFDIQKEDDHKSEPRKLSQIISPNQNYMEEFTQFDSCYPKTEGNNFKIITEDQ